MSTMMGTMVTMRFLRISSGGCAYEAGGEIRTKFRYPHKNNEVKLPRVTQNSLPTVASFRTWRG